MCCRRLNIPSTAVATCYSILTTVEYEIALKCVLAVAFSPSCLSPLIPIMDKEMNVLHIIMYSGCLRLRCFCQLILSFTSFDFNV